MNKLTLVNNIKLVIALQCIVCVDATAGAYVFADEINGADIITHPSNYTGNNQSTLTVKVCIDSNSLNATEMEYSVQNNIDAFNQMVPTTANVKSGSNNNIPENYVDFESVALHELGHCLGLAHPNAASESGATGNNQNHTRATDGANNNFDFNAGADGIVGSSDDNRGDDVNLMWFRKSNNNPFTIDTIIDSTTYSNLASNLPSGHSFAVNADRTVSTNVYSLMKTEAVMQQGTYDDEAQRTLGHDDVATLLYAASGIDEQQTGGGKTRDNYTLVLEYVGISNSSTCDITMSMTTTSGFAACTTDGVGVEGNHARVTSASIEFGNGFNWFFNSETPPDADGDGLSDDDEAAIGTNPNDPDSDDDGLSDYEEVITYGTLPNDSDSDDDFINDYDEVINGSDPNDDTSWPNFADGDFAPSGAPDGIINAADYLIAQRIALGEIDATSLELSHGDLFPPGSPDGMIDTSDLILLLKLIQ